MADDPKYITRLMRIRCSKGTMDNYINVGTDHGVLAGAEQQPVLNANDHTEENIIHCGNCESDENPERMFRKGLASDLMESVGIFFGDLITDALEDMGIMTCKCKPNTPVPWIYTNESNILEGAPALTMESKVACRYGGVIEFVPLEQYPPEEPEAMAEQEEEATEEDVPPDTVKEEVAAALEAAMKAIADTGEGGKEAVQRAQQAMLDAVADVQSGKSMAPYNRTELMNNISDFTIEKGFSITNEQRMINYAHNMQMTIPSKALDSNGQIIDQNLLNDFYINNSTVAYSGCGAVSLYNTIKILDPDTEITFPQVIYWMEPYGVLNNALGALPTGPGDILEKLGYEVTYSYSHDPTEIAQMAAQADAAISYYMTPQYFHFVAFQPVSTDTASGQPIFEFYNEIIMEGDQRSYEDFQTHKHSGAKEWASITILVERK